jgi:hypothetical protein
MKGPFDLHVGRTGNKEPRAEILSKESALPMWRKRVRVELTRASEANSRRF